MSDIPDNDLYASPRYAVELLRSLLNEAGADQ